MPTQTPRMRPLPGHRDPSTPAWTQAWKKHAYAFVRRPRRRWARPWAARRVGWPDARPPCGPAVLIPGGPSAVIAWHLGGLSTESRAGTAHRLQGTEAAHTAAQAPPATRPPTPSMHTAVPPHAPCPLRPSAHPHTASQALGIIGSGTAPFQPIPCPSRDCTAAFALWAAAGDERHGWVRVGGCWLPRATCVAMRRLYASHPGHCSMRGQPGQPLPAPGAARGLARTPGLGAA